MTQVVLIEDDANLQHLLKTLLELDNYKVRLLDYSSQNILQELLNEPPEILIIDAHLGKYDGLAILKKIRLETSLNNLRILMTSGENLKEISKESGADGFLLKPYTPSELIDWLKVA